MVVRPIAQGFMPHGYPVDASSTAFTTALSTPVDSRRAGGIFRLGRNLFTSRIEFSDTPHFLLDWRLL